MSKWTLFILFFVIGCESSGPVRKGYVISETHPETHSEAVPEAITAWELVGEESPPTP